MVSYLASLEEANHEGQSALSDRLASAYQKEAKRSSNLVAEFGAISAKVLEAQELIQSMEGCSERLAKKTAESRLSAETKAEPLDHLPASLSSTILQPGPNQHAHEYW